MEGTYDVCFAGEKIGRVAVSKQGLYYHFRARCQMLEGLFLLYCADVKLGLLVPKDGQMVLDTKVSTKQIGACRFWVRPKHEPVQDSFVPLSPQEPFAYLQQLEGAYLARRGGSLGVCFPAKNL